MMAFQFLGPVISAVLYVIVFQKAGFKGAVLAVCATPILGLIVFQMMFHLIGYGYGVGMMALPLVGIVLSLLPLAVLAFKSWPPVAAPNSRSEK